jgi:hypothetical protein
MQDIIHRQNFLESSFNNGKDLFTRADLTKGGNEIRLVCPQKEMGNTYAESQGNKGEYKEPFGKYRYLLESIG